MRAYIIAIVFISALHVYFSINKGESPLSPVFLVLILSSFIPLIWQEASKIKLGKDGLEFERLKKDVDRSIKRAIQRKVIEPQAIDDLFKTVELNEWITLVLTRMLMRQGLVYLVPDHGLGPSPSLTKLISLCYEKNLISLQEKDDLNRLRSITFYAEWWGGDPPTHGDWAWALNNCKGIVRAIFEKQSII